MEGVENLAHKYCHVQKIHFPAQTEANEAPPSQAVTYQDTKKTQEEEDDEDEDILVSRVVLGGKPYLVDDVGNVYDAETHEHVGTREGDVLVPCN
ncbi:MAG: hypothetical protein EBR99_06600 [Actinobacteria bacterium]|nr:hypothetical protein [Actinomycetota bacterium]